jgi:subtilase family serine protease
MGAMKLGLTTGSAISSTDEVPRKAFIYKPARYMQIEIRTQNRTDNYELLGVKAVAIPQSRGNNPSSWNVS